MRSKHLAIVSFAIILMSLLTVAQRGQSQSSSATRMITDQIDDSKLVVLKGNTNPRANAQNDRGPAPASEPMERMMMVLKRSPAQQAALDTFLAQQAEPGSPNFRKGLTATEFGQRFGLSDDDLSQVTTWLQSHGFQIDNVAKGRNVIAFSGDAGQVEEAFHTSIHSYMVNGFQHWSNSSDPSIPAALAPAVYGPLPINNFNRRRMSQYAGTFRRNANGRMQRVSPQLTYPSPNNPCDTGNTCYALAPQDFATIYNVNGAYSAGFTGQGVTIAIVGDSNINLTDVSQFRSLFGLPANTPKVTLNGANPGIIPCADNGDECEAIIDVEWSGAVAKNATINYVLSPTTNASNGIDASSQYAVDHQVGSIVSSSYGLCEADLGSTENAFYNSIWSQAASENITAVVSTGDSGSAGCDQDETNNPAEQPATGGLAVNGLGSTPFNVAVGGTDFTVQLANPAQFWNSTNTSSGGSAKGYIPETTWNDSCTNATLSTYFTGFSATPETNCNTAAFAQIIAPVGGSGGASIIYSKPSFQTGTGVPSDGRRDVPDLSLFAGDGYAGSFYAVCELDLDDANCSDSTSNPVFAGFGGTSVSTQVFAGIMALVDQKAGAQGNFNTVLYPLAAKQNPSSCNTSNSPTNCVFYDVTAGTNAQPCLFNVSPNCNRTNSADTIGILTGFSAGTGYDQATGLGSVNVANLVAAVSAGSVTPPTGDFSVGPSSGSASVASPGGSTTYAVTVTGTNGFAGAVSITCSLPSNVEASCSASPASVTLSATTTTGASTLAITTTPTGTALLSPRNPGANGGAPLLASLFASNVQRGVAAMFGITLVLCAGLFVFAPKNRLRHSTAAFALLIFGLVFIASCGGGSGGGGGGSTGTPTGTFTGTVTATSGGTSSTTTFTLTVN
jgi:subtilase family serine protease